MGWGKWEGGVGDGVGGWRGVSGRMGWGKWEDGVG
jgi:hypothetical protein